MDSSNSSVFLEPHDLEKGYASSCSSVSSLLPDKETAQSQALLDGLERRTEDCTPLWSPNAFKESLLSCSYIFLNAVSSIALVFLNKRVFSDPQFRGMQAVVALWHFACTGCILFVASQRPCGLFEAVRLPFVQMMPLCVFFTGFLVLNNLSLTFNPVGFYQMAKHLTMPAIVILNFCVFKKSISLPVSLSLASIVVGVGIVNADGMKSNVLGAIIATTAFITTAAYQIWIGKKLDDFRVSSSQLLLNQAPLSCLILAVMAPFTDNIVDFQPMKVEKETVAALMASGLVAALLNLSQFLIIGRTSALTFNVAGSFKTVAILLLAWTSEHATVGVQELCGVALAIGGALVYSQLG